MQIGEALSLLHVWSSCPGEIYVFQAQQGRPSIVKQVWRAWQFRDFVKADSLDMD